LPPAFVPNVASRAPPVPIVATIATERAGIKRRRLCARGGPPAWPSDPVFPDNSKLFFRLSPFQILKSRFHADFAFRALHFFLK